MRTLVLSLAVAAALGLAGCSGNTGAAQESAPASGTSSAGVQIASSVSGSVGLLEARELSDKAVLTIKLVDVSAHDAAPLATRTVTPVTKLPVAFTFKVDPAKINPADIYAVQASMVDGERHFTMAVPAPVLTKGASAQANIKLKAIPTPGEELMVEYKKVEAKLGGMALSKGTSLSKSSSRGWQVFRNNESGEVAYVIELTHYFDKGYTRTDFAYKDGQPWVVIVKHKSSEKAKPNQIDRAGWEHGDLVLKEQVTDGKTSELDAATAAKLHKQAEAMLATAKKTH